MVCGGLTLTMRVYIRDEKIKKSGSPYYSISVGAIAAGITLHFSVEKSAGLAGADKYTPLDWMEIVNDDVVDIEVAVGIGKFPVLAGTIRTIDNNWYSTFSVTNLDSSTATTAGKTKITCRREPISMDKLARKFPL